MASFLCGRCKAFEKAKGCWLCKKCAADSTRARRAADPELFKAKANAWRAANKSILNEKKKAWRVKKRLVVLQYYSGSDSPFCKCCGEERLEFLSIDHIDGAGGIQRKTVGKGSDNMYRWIIRKGFPANFRVLCHNCNLSRGFYKYCPHEREVKNFSLEKYR